MSKLIIKKNIFSTDNFFQKLTKAASIPVHTPLLFTFGKSIPRVNTPKIGPRVALESVNVNWTRFVAVIDKIAARITIPPMIKAYRKEEKKVISSIVFFTEFCI